jgi:hypothetical protein
MRLSNSSDVEEQKRREGLAEIIEQLEELTLRQSRLAQQSARAARATPRSGPTRT